MSALGVSRYRRAGVLVLAGLLVGLLASCSDDGASSSAPPQTSTAPPSEQSAPGPDEATSLFVLEADEGEAEAAGDAGTYDLSLCYRRALIGPHCSSTRQAPFDRSTP